MARRRGRALVPRLWRLGFFAGVLALLLGACSADGGSSEGASGGRAGSQTDGAAATGGSGATGGGSGGGGSGGGGGLLVDSGDAGDAAPPTAADPTTCQEAAEQKSYVGCDFWPTVTFNPVWSIFDFTALVANTGEEPAEVTITLGPTFIETKTVAPNQLMPFYLPWIPDLKGADSGPCGTGTPPTASVRVNDGAYHLVSTRPVTVWQFSPLEYRDQGGPAGKDWTTCPANQCTIVPCNSYSNDASLLIPTAAMTGNYRVTTLADHVIPGLAGNDNIPGFVAITATQDATTVDVKLSATGQVMAGTNVAAAGPGEVFTLSMDAGDVVELVSNGVPPADLGGSLVQADKPVQVLAGSPCAQVPANVAACDHVEESVLPAETLGQRYFVVPPIGPRGQPVGHVVRVFGNVDNTQLSYPSGTPGNAPAVINAGQVFDMGVVTQAFEIVGDHEFAVATFQQGGAAVDAATLQGTRQGDPAQSQAIAVEQFRKRYLFIAPLDYNSNFVSVIMRDGAKILLDGQQLPIAAVPIGQSGWGVANVPLTAGSAGGVHLLVATDDQTFGIQVMGYGTNTSYQYPGGLALTGIAPPPPPVK